MKNKTKESKIDPFLAAGCLFGAISVGMGAFGAHALKETLTTNGTVETWKTAVDYQMWHALALLICGLLKQPTCKTTSASIAFMVGILLFSGSLYGLALGGPRWLGPITPLGGLSFIAGWILLMLTQLGGKKSEN